MMNEILISLPMLSLADKDYTDKLWLDRQSVDFNGKHLYGLSDEALLQWAINGITVIPKAVPEDLIDLLLARLDNILAGASVKSGFVDRLLTLFRKRTQFKPEHPLMTCWQDKAHYFGLLNAEFLKEREAKILDLHNLLSEARQLAFAPLIFRHLACAFQDSPIAFQSLFFLRGSEQGAHQDTAFVYTTPVPHFVAAWIALEDIRPGTGELFYYQRSHHLPDILGSRGTKALHPGDAALSDYGKDLIQICEEASLTPLTFLPRKGDVLLWNYDIVHGGSPIMDTSATRKSLVVHYCPSSAAIPYESEHGQRNRLEFPIKIDPDGRGPINHYYVSSNYYRRPTRW
jgi:hypothetical protein